MKMAPTSVRSDVWQYFTTTEDKKYVECNACKRRIKKCGNTTNMRNHLRTKHTKWLKQESVVEGFQGLQEGREIVPLPGGRSEIWKRKLFGFYSNEDKTILDKEKAVCTLCFIEIPFCGNTTNLGNHLAKQHPDVYLSMKDEIEMGECNTTYPGQKNNAGFMVAHNSQTPQQMFPKTTTRSAHITDAVASFLAMGLHPFGVAEETGFRHLLKVLEPHYEPVENQVLGEVIQTKKQAITNILLEKLTEIDACTLAIESWSAENGRNYYTVMVRYIDSNWEVKNFVLKTLEITPDQVHYKQVVDINNVLTEWALKPNIIYDQPVETGVDEKIVITIDFSQMKARVGVTNDNGSVAEAIKAFGMTSLPCFANVLNTAAEAGVDRTKAPMVSELISKSRRLVSHFVRNSKDRATLSVKNESMNHCEGLVLDDNNVWTTISKMIGSLLDNKNSINSVLMSHKERSVRELGLSPEEWYQIEELNGAMQAISMGIGIVGGDEHASCSMVAPLLHRLKEKFMKISEHDTPTVLQYKKVVWDHLNPHYSDADVQSLLNISAFLDPRFKDLVHLTSQEREEVVQSVHQLVLQIESGITEESQQDENADSSPPKSRRRLQELDLLFGSTEDSAQESAGSDLDKYVQETSIGIKKSPLEWWRLNSHRYPTVARLASGYMGIPAIAVPSECILSQDGSIFYNRRKRLMVEEVDDLIFLNKNFNLLH